MYPGSIFSAHCARSIAPPSHEVPTRSSNAIRHPANAMSRNFLFLNALMHSILNISFTFFSFNFQKYPNLSHYRRLFLISQVFTCFFISQNVFIVDERLVSFFQMYKKNQNLFLLIILLLHQYKLLNVLAYDYHYQS